MGKEEVLVNDPWDLATKIFELKEVGSSEFKSSKIICDILHVHGFKVETNYKGIPTAFRAEKIKGNGNVTVAFLAEYDALLGIGHACGHNLITAANTYGAIKASELIKDGKIVVIGTPDEEGTGEYAGSKILLAERGAFEDVDLILGAHPGAQWRIVGNSLAVQDLEITFKGFSSHEAASPQKGRSALDAAILTYTGINMLRQHLRRDANPVIHGVIREGGEASNVTPDRAVMVYGIRSSDMDYHKELLEKIEMVIKGCSIATFTDFEIKKIGPVFSTVKHNRPLSELLYSIVKSKQIDVPDYEESLKELAGGSTDFSNVTHEKPALEIHFKIAPAGTPWHSKQSLEAANSEEAKKTLPVVIDVLSEAAVQFSEDSELRKKIKDEFLITK